MAMLPSLDSSLPNWAADNIPSSELAADGVETEPHVTVLYGFDLSFDVSKLGDFLAGRQPPVLMLGAVSRFECDDYDVIKVDVSSPGLRDLNRRLLARFEGEVTESKWPYNPHLTVAYVKKGACRQLDGRRDFSLRSFKAARMLYSLPEKQGRVVFSLPDDGGGSASPACQGRRRSDATLTGASFRPEAGSGDILRAVRAERLMRRAAAVLAKAGTGVPDAPSAVLAPGNSRPARALQSYEAFETTRREAAAVVAKAVRRVVAVAESVALRPERKQEDDDYLGGYAFAAFRAATAQAYGLAAGQLAGQVGGQSPATAAEESEHASERAPLLEAFPARTLERLRAEAWLAELVGDSPEEKVRRVHALGEKAADGEGRTLADTEAQAACGKGQLRALKAAGYATARWVTVGDERVRDTHTECEAAGPVALGEKYPNGCRYPGDPDGRVEETANCRCWLEGADRAGEEATQ